MTLPKIRKSCACGKQARLIERILIMCNVGRREKASYSVECDCGVHTEGYTAKSAAIRAWNAGYVRSAKGLVEQ